MSRTSKVEQLLDDLLAAPDWYAAILLTQVRPRRLITLLRQTCRRSDRAVCEMVKGHSWKELPEVLRSCDESRLSLLEIDLEGELVRVVDRLPVRVLFQLWRFYTDRVNDSIKLFRSQYSSGGGGRKRVARQRK